MSYTQNNTLILSDLKKTDT